jgi:hypothetical protein
MYREEASRTDLLGLRQTLGEGEMGVTAGFLVAN